MEIDLTTLSPAEGRKINLRGHERINERGRRKNCPATYTTSDFLSNVCDIFDSLTSLDPKLLFKWNHLKPKTVS